jgi:hypothetical protein
LELNALAPPKDQQSEERPGAIKMLRYKTDARVWHPPEDMINRLIVRFYPEAEAIPEKLAGAASPMVRREFETRKEQSETVQLRRF